MNVNSVTASGSANGATFMPMADSTCSRIITVMDSKKYCTGFGTPEVILARR